jgi:hypothetical protein
MINDLTWTRTKPTDAGYYWVRTQGYMRGIIVWVYVGGDGKLVADWPLYSRLECLAASWWAGPLPEPVGCADYDDEDDKR